MSLYEQGAGEGGFEAGVAHGARRRCSRARDSSSVSKSAPARRAPASAYALRDLDLASRLSFFLWATRPDDELLRARRAGPAVATPAVLEQQVRRMLADRRSDVLASRFAAQWLRLQDLDKINPDVATTRTSTSSSKTRCAAKPSCSSRHIVREDRQRARAVHRRLHVRQRAAGHGTTGFRTWSAASSARCRYTDEPRRGLLGHGSILTLTSHADRTSPVLRGKWVMEVLLGTPPPPPPPDVPDLEATARGGGRTAAARCASAWSSTARVRPARRATR